MARGGKRLGAGRPIAAHTIQAEAFKKYLIERVILEKKPLVQALIRKGKKGDVPALKEILERILGKVMQPLGGEKGGPLTILWKK